MVKIRERGEKIRYFIVSHVERHPSDISTVVAKEFGITRQAAHKHLTTLVTEGSLSSTGQTRNRKYSLVPLSDWIQSYETKEPLAEDVVWRNDIEPLIANLPSNAKSIWQYGFTEMFNNAIDHAEGKDIWVAVKKTAANTEITVSDNGVGIFKKIQTQLNLLDERHAVLELSKGKLTTDPSNHTGEGIFFSSRMFDEFQILSGETYFSHDSKDDRDWILQRAKPGAHTTVFMNLKNHTSRTTKAIFRKFTSGDNRAFTKTVVPVRLAQYGQESLISRSQAKRLLARVDRFKTVILDFEGVTEIGQAFADEIFRVFANQHAEVDLIPINEVDDVKQMIARAKANQMGTLAYILQKPQ